MSIPQIIFDDDVRAALAKPEQKPEQKPYPLPKSLYPDSKDWVASDYASRVEWLHSMYEAKKQELHAALAQPEPVIPSEIKGNKTQPEQEPVAWMHKETGLLRREISRPKAADWDANYWQPLYAAAQPTAETIAQEWDLLKETQASLRDAWAILKKLKTVQDAARNLVESDPESAADTEGKAFTAWCALVAAIDDADTLLCEFGESHE